MTTTAAPTYLTIAQAARRLHRKPWPVFQAIERGELPASQPGGDGPWLIRPEDLAAYVERFAGRGTTGGTLGQRLARR